MTIRQASQGDLKGLVALYKKAFKRHHVFEQSESEIFAYLTDQNSKNAEVGGLLISEKSGKVVGGLLIKKAHYDSKGKHLVVNYNHLVGSSDIASELVNHADKLLKGKKHKSVKVEVSVAEKETLSPEFYKKQGFKVEGKLKDHYRAKELVTLLGKIF